MLINLSCNNSGNKRLQLSGPSKRPKSEPSRKSDVDNMSKIKSKSGGGKSYLHASSSNKKLSGRG